MSGTFAPPALALGPRPPAPSRSNPILARRSSAAALAGGFGLSGALLLVWAPAVLAFAGLLMASAFLLNLLVRGLTREDRQLGDQLIRWTFAALAVHLALGLAIDQVRSLVWVLELDSIVYHSTAVELVAHWTRDLPLSIVHGGKEGFTYMLAGLYRFLGPHRALGLTANCAMSAALVPLMTDATGRLFGRAAARCAPPFLLLLPGLLLWPSLLLREAAILFLIAVSISCAVRLSERLTVLPTAILILSLATLFTFRSHVAAVVAVGLVVGLVLGNVRLVRGMSIGVFVAAVLVVGVVVSGFGYGGYRFVTQHGNLDSLEVVREGTEGRTSFDADIDVSTPQAALRYLPTGVVKLLLGPFPWTIRNPRDIAVVPDVVASWMLIPLIWRGLKSGASHVGRRILMLLLPAILVTLALGILLNNFAVVSRQRPQVMLFLVPLIALAWSRRAVRAPEFAPAPGGADGAAIGWSAPGLRPRSIPPAALHREEPVEARNPDGRMLQRHLRVLGQHKRVIAVGALVGLVSVVGLARFRTPGYSATAEVVLQPGIAEPLFAGGQPVRTVQLEGRVVRSKAVRDAVHEELGRDVGVSVTPAPDTNTLHVTGHSGSPTDAALIANAYVNAYVELRQREVFDELDKAAREIRNKMDEIQREIDSTNAEISSAPVGARPTLEQSVGVRRTNLVSEQSVFKQKLDQLEVEKSVRTGGVRVLSPAEPPAARSGGASIQMTVVGMVAGLVAGLGIAYVSDQMSGRIRDRREVDGLARGLPVVGLIPFDARRRRQGPSVMLDGDGPSATADAYQLLATAANILATRYAMRAIQITSASSSEGKTTTAANLAVTLARDGRRVVLADCDLRTPRVHELFGLSNISGFVEVAQGTAPLGTTLQQVPGEANLLLLASGTPPSHPAHVLSSKGAADVLNALTAQADVVVVDSPEVTSFADALVLSSQVDATLVVAAVGKTERRQLIEAIERLRQIEAPLAGIVVHAPPAHR